MTYEELQETILNNIKRLKDERKMTIAELARLTGISAVTISMIINGHRACGLHTLNTIANGFEVDIKELLNG